MVPSGIIFRPATETDVSFNKRLRSKDLSKRLYKSAWARHKRERIAGRPRPDKCEVCHSPPNNGKNVLCFDHKHGTEQFRGWLCAQCNLALGYAGDNPRLLKKLAEYLESNGFTTTRPVIC